MKSSLDHAERVVGRGTVSNPPKPQSYFFLRTGLRTVFPVFSGRSICRDLQQWFIDLHDALLPEREEAKWATFSQGEGTGLLGIVRILVKRNPRTQPPSSL